MTLFLFGGKAYSQTGKIAGVVTDSSDNPLPGVNVLIVGEETGVATGEEGRFNLLNVPVGVYTLRFSFVGYQTKRIQGVEVNNNLTTNLEVILAEEQVGLQEVTVVAQDEPVKEDISASRVDIDMESVESNPVASINEMVELQPGIQSGLQVRGSERGEISYQLDGFSLQSQRSGSPYSNISLTGIKQVSTQTGGFSASEGNLRSGLVNVVTREGPTDRYTVDVFSRYRAPTEKHFGPKFNSGETYALRPFLDPEVKWEGTDQWDDFTRRQHPDFDGFEEIARETLGDNNPNNNLTPRAAEQLFRWRHRRDVTINSPDWVFDGSIGGPVPGISDYLGDLRFFASYRQVDREYILPLNTRGYDARNTRLKLTADVTSDIKLDLIGMTGREEGTRIGSGANLSNRRAQVRREDREAVITSYGPTGFTWMTNEVVFSPSGLSRSIVERDMLSAKVTHNVSSSTFYNARVMWFRSDFKAGPGLRGRSTETVRSFAEFEANEAPMGYRFGTGSSLPAQLRLAGHNSVLRDTSLYNQFDFKLDFTSQVFPSHQVNAGIQFNISDQQERVEAVDALRDPSDTEHQWNVQPIYGAGYLEDKIEFEGMIANLGVRLDYFHPRTEFINFQGSFNDVFANAENLGELSKREADPFVKVSPRVGVSFPVTEQSKIFFNYGHFVQIPDAEDLYQTAISKLTNGIFRIGNPFLKMPQTTSYELGYEQSFFGQYLVRAAGFYKDITNQTVDIQFQGQQGLVSYTSPFNQSYEDIRGFEVSVRKSSGQWIRGFVNYTFRVSKSGDFGFGTFFENPIEQRRFERETTENIQFRPQPQPFLRASLTFLTPGNFGPEFGWLQPFGHWSLNFLGRWKSGEVFTYTGPTDVPGLQDNFEWPDFKMVDLRISKDFSLRDTNLNFFLDINNFLNLENFNTGAFSGGSDFDSYMQSLALPESKTEEFDRWPGDNGNQSPGDVGEGVDPPNLQSLLHLYPRSYKFGVRYSF